MRGLIRGIVIVIFLLSVGHATPLLAKGAATGADAIFDVMGVAKPLAWSTWSEQEKFRYLQERGAYPVQGRKYRGSFDVDRYFAFLGIEQPDDWLQKTSAQRIAFINELSTVMPDATTPSSIVSVAQEKKSTQSDVPLRQNAMQDPSRPAAIHAQKSPLTTPWLVLFYGVVAGGVGIYALRLWRTL